MNYYCRQCQKPLKYGQETCSCGQIFNNPVPEKDDQIGVVYWEPPLPNSREAQIQRIRDTWYSINPTQKAAGFGGFAVLLIACSFLGSHHAAPSVAPHVVVAPIVPPTAAAQPSTSIQPVTPAMPAPIVLDTPHPVRSSKMVKSTSDITTSQPSTQQNSDTSGGQQQVTPQLPSIDQQVAVLNSQGTVLNNRNLPSVALDGPAGDRDQPTVVVFDPGKVEQREKDMDALRSIIGQLRQIDPDGSHGSQADQLETDLSSIQADLDYYIKSVNDSRGLQSVH